MQLTVARFSIAWLTIANLVGTLLAAMLVWPAINRWLAPFTYGRWMPLHMDWQLYGWCSLPLLGILAMRYWDHNDKGTDRTKSAFVLWSLSLIGGGVSWILGEATGKPFLNWSGWSRWCFAFSLAAIWIWTLIGAFERWKRKEALGEGVAIGLGKSVFALLLGAVPIALFLTSDASVYPPVDPDSGGATGHSLVASTLGIVFLMGILPSIGLRLPAKGSGAKWREKVFWAAFVASVFVYLAMEHGNASNRSANQIVGLGTLMIWPALVWLYWGSREWSSASKIWRQAFFFWWALLAITGWLTFLPGLLTILKFTNGLVAHAHLAMAGMVSAMNAVILIECGDGSLTRRILGDRTNATLWNGATLVYVAVMMFQGFREGEEPERLFLFDGVSEFNYSIRLLAGALMTYISIRWSAQLARANAGHRNGEPEMKGAMPL